MVMNLAPSVEMTLLKSVLATIMSAVGCSDLAGIVDPVASYDKLCSVAFGLLGSHCADKLAIRDVLASCDWNVFFVYELDGVSGFFLFVLQHHLPIAQLRWRRKGSMVPCIQGVA